MMWCNRRSFRKIIPYQGYNKNILLYKRVNNLTQSYISPLFNFRYSDDKNTMAIPKHNTELLTKSFQYSVTQICYLLNGQHAAFRHVSKISLIRHVFGFGTEFFENKDIGIFGHFIVIDFIKRNSYHTYFSPI